MAERVVEGEDRVEGDALLEQTAHRGRAVLAVPRGGDAHEGRVVGQPRRLERLAVAADAEVGRADVVLIHRVRPDDGDAAATDLDQVLGRGPCRLDVVHRHVVGRPAEHALAEQDEREAHVEQIDVLLPEALWAEQHPVGQAQSSRPRARRARPRASRRSDR